MKAWFARVGRSMVRDRRVVIVTVIVLAVIGGLLYARPWSQTKFDLADPGVFVTNVNSSGSVHHIDTPVHQEDASLQVDGGTKVSQSGSDVVIWTDNTINGVTPATMTKGTPVPARDAISDVEVGGGSVAELGAGDGVSSVYTGTIAGPDVSLSTQPEFTFKGDGSLAVGQDGTIAAFSFASGALFVKHPGARGVKYQVPSGTDQLTVAGGQAVLLDGASHSLVYQDGSTQSLAGWGAGAILQTVNLSTGPPVVATSEGLLSVPEGSQPSWIDRLRHPAQDPATRPVVDAEGCAHGAWAAPLEVVTACPTGPAEAPQLLSEARQPPGSVQTTSAVNGTLTFRASGTGTVLNDLSTGNSFETVDGSTYEIPWAASVDSTANTPPLPRPRDPKDSTDIQAPTIKLNAWLGTRAALPVLADDYDKAGDVLSIADGSVTPSGSATPSSVQPLIHTAPDHTHVLLDLTGANPPVAAGSEIDFQYLVTNGRAGVTPKQGSVVVTVLARDAPGDPPVEKGPAPTLYLAPQSTTRYFVLNDWWSKQGTPLTVANAAISGGATAVTLPGDGSILISDYDGGQESVHVTVEDISGVASSYDISLLPAPGSGSPTVTDDYVSGVAGTQLTALPLNGDRDPLTGGSSSLTLAQCQRLGPSTDPKPTCDATSMSITPTAPGSYSYSYEAVGRSGQSTTGYVRFEVTSPALSVASVAVRLPVGGMATADLLAGQTETSGVLAVTHVDTPPSNTGLITELVANRYIRVIDTGSLGKAQTLNFTVSDGTTNTASAQLFIVPVQPDPTVTIVAPPQNVQVVQGNIATVPVLTTDYSEMGWPLKVVTVSQPGQGRAWTDGSTIRYEPGTAGSYTINYQVEDEPLTGEVHDQIGTVQVLVTAPPTGPQADPKPDDLEVRVAANGSVSIPIPLLLNADGTPIDPAGLPITPLAVSQQGQSGQATLNGDVLTYRSNSSSGFGGADTFRYEVRDSLGNVGVGTVHVVIFPSGTCDLPTAAPVRLSVGLGTSPVIPVLNSATDPCDRSLSVAEVAGPDKQVLDAEAVATGVAVHVPTSCGTPCSWTLTYRVRNGTDTSASAAITLDGIPAGQKSGINPTATDIFPGYPSNGHTVTVSIAPYVSNPGDPGEQLSLTLSGQSYGATADSGRLTVTAPLQKSTVPLLYQVTDPKTQLTATAVIWLPGIGNPTPTYSDQAPISVKAGSTTSIQLTNYFTVPSGYQLKSTPLSSIVGPIPGSTASLSGTELEVTIPGSAASQLVSQTVSLEAAGGSEAPRPSSFALRLEIVGKNAPVAVPCSTTAYPTAADVVDLASCVIPGSAQLADLNFSVGDASQASVAILGNGTSDPQARITPGSGALGSTSVVINATDPAANKSTPIRISVNVVKPDLQITAASSSPVVKVGQSLSIDMSGLVTVTGPPNYQGGDLSYTITAQSTEPDAVTTQASGSEVTLTGVKYADQPITVDYTVTTKEGGQRQGQILVTVEGPPGAPTSPGATDDSDQSGYKMKVTWGSPLSDGGVVVTNYIVTASNGSTCQDPHITFQCTVVGLQAHTPYTFTIQAVNSVNSGPSVQTAQVETTGPPNAPGAPTATPIVTNSGTNSATVTWPPSPVTGISGDDVTQYVVTSDPPSMGCAIGGTQNSCAVNNLSYNDQYTFFVQAINKVSKSPLSAGSLVKYVPDTFPDAPTIQMAAALPAAAGDSSTMARVNVTWTLPASDEGDPISEYVVIANDDQNLLCTATGATANSCEYTDLTYGVPYTFKVHAVNSVGPSSESDVSNSVTPVGPPSLPGSPSCVTTSLATSTATVQCTWSASISNGFDSSGSGITYVVTAQNQDNDSTTTCSPGPSGQSTSEPSCDLKLQLAAPFEVWVVASNSQSSISSQESGQGSWSYTAPTAECFVLSSSSANLSAQVTVSGFQTGIDGFTVKDLTDTSVQSGSIEAPNLTTTMDGVAVGDKLSLQPTFGSAEVATAFTTLCSSAAPDPPPSP